MERDEGPQRAARGVFCCCGTELKFFYSKPGSTRVEPGAFGAGGNIASLVIIVPPLLAQLAQGAVPAITPPEYDAPLITPPSKAAPLVPQVEQGAGVGASHGQSRFL